MVKTDAGAVSLTMPLSRKQYTSNILFPFFDGLIPEGWLLDVVSRNWKVDRNDRFGLLLIACRDSIGNVSIRGEKNEMLVLRKGIFIGEFAEWMA